MHVSDVSQSANVHVASALSPHSLLFPFSDSAALSSFSSLSTLPMGTPSASSALPAFFSSSFLSSSLGGVSSVSSISSSPMPPPPPLPSVAPSAPSLVTGPPRSGVSLPPPPGFSSYFSLLVIPSFSICSFFFLHGFCSSSFCLSAPIFGSSFYSSCFFLSSHLFLFLFRFLFLFVSGFRFIPGSGVRFF